MLGSIYTGLSGMNAYTQGLQTISNNVANLNSLGFKGNSVQFSEVFGQGGGGGLTFTGNGSGHGAGVTFGQPLVDFSQGDMRQTSNDLDLAIQGNGFLVLRSNGETYYTRTGQFFVDAEGFVTLQGTDHRLMLLDADRQPVEVNLDQKRTSAPVVTTTVKFADNLSSTGTTAAVSNIAVFDNRGGRQVWTVTFTAVGSTAPGEWDVKVTDQSSATLATSRLKFIGSTVDPATSKLTVNTTPAGADPLSIILDFSSGVTSFSSGTTSSIRTSSVDGSGVGSLTKVGIDDKGSLKLTYSNEKTDTLGAVAIADFRSPQDLTRVGQSLFQNKGNAEFRMLPSNTEGIGQLVSRQLEASNVDLSQEFGDLILIQRGFQASSQVVSITNDMIQELFGIRGRG